MTVDQDLVDVGTVNTSRPLGCDCRLLREKRKDWDVAVYCSEDATGEDGLCDYCREHHA